MSALDCREEMSRSTLEFVCLIIAENGYATAYNPEITRNENSSLHDLKKMNELLICS